MPRARGRHPHLAPPLRRDGALPLARALALALALALTLTLTLTRTLLLTLTLSLSLPLSPEQAGGCIPILFAPFEDIAPNLPFPHSLDWKRLALFGGGLTCSFVQHSNQTIAWLRELLDPAHEVSGL